MLYSIKRCAAFLIDVLIGIVIIAVTNKIVPALITLQSVRSFASLPVMLWSLYAADMAALISYFFLCEGILLPATIGKMLMKLRVVTLNAPRHRMAIFLRTLSKLAPIIIFEYLTYTVLIDSRIEQHMHGPNELPATPLTITCMGSALIAYLIISYGMAFFNSKKQALHDKIAKTIVIQTV